MTPSFQTDMSGHINSVDPDQTTPEGSGSALFAILSTFVLRHYSMVNPHCSNFWIITGWLGWVMALGSFQCRGVLLLLHIVGQGPAVLAAGAGRVGYIFYIFHLSSLSNVLSFGRRLKMTEILWFRLLNPKGTCQLLLRTSSLSTG